MSITYDDLKSYTCNKLFYTYGGSLTAYEKAYDLFMNNYGMLGSTDFFTLRNLIIYLNNVVNFINKYQTIHISTTVGNSDLSPGKAGRKHQMHDTTVSCPTSCVKSFKQNSISVTGLDRVYDNDCIVANDMNVLLKTLSTCLYNKSKVYTSMTSLGSLTYCSCSSSSSSSSSSSCSMFIAYLDLSLF